MLSNHWMESTFRLRMMRHKAFIAIVISAILLTLIYLFLPAKTPEESFEEFLSLETKESYLTDPLCAAGRKVVPIVLEKIKDRELDKRRYAISFLGSADYPEALPGLKIILEDESELDVFRGDALGVVFLLNESSGRDYARRYRNRSDYLGKISNELLEVKNYEGYKKRVQHEKCSPSD